MFLYQCEILIKTVKLRSIPDEKTMFVKCNKILQFIFFEFNTQTSLFYVKLIKCAIIKFRNFSFNLTTWKVCGLWEKRQVEIMKLYLTDVPHKN